MLGSSHMYLIKVHLLGDVPPSHPDTAEHWACLYARPMSPAAQGKVSRSTIGGRFSVEDAGPAMVRGPGMVETVGFAVRALAAPWIAGARWSDGRAMRTFRGVAQARASWTVGLKAACDEVLYLSELVGGAPIAFFETPRLRREAFAAIDQFAARGWLERPETYHCLPPPLSAPSVESVTAVPGLSYEHVSFASEYAPWEGEVGRERWLAYAPNHTAHARVFRHPG